MTHPLDDARARRVPLETRPLPATALETVVTLGGRLGPGLQAAGQGWLPAGPVEVTVRYIPDRLALPPSSLDAYLSSLASGRWDGLESLVAVMVGDLDSEIVPYWVQVRLECDEGPPRYGAVAEQRRPDWDNRLLLARLMLD